MSRRGTKTRYPGVWQLDSCRFTVLVTITAGSRRIYREKVITGTIHEARQAQLELQDSVLSDDLELGVLADKWLQSLQVNRSTYNTYQFHLRRYFLPVTGTLKLNDLKRIDVFNWFTGLSVKLSKATQASIWRSVRAFLRWSCLLHQQADITAGLRLVGSGKEPTEKAGLTPDQLRAFILEALREPEPYRSILVIAATTGMRIGEILALHAEDIEDRSIIVRRSLTAGIVNNHTKTRNVRVVPLHPLLDFSGKSGLLFTNRGGTFFRQTSDFRRALNRIAARAKLPRVNLHKLRRSVNDIVRTHSGAAVAQSLLGHATESMSVHYSTVRLPEKERALAELLELTVGVAGVDSEENVQKGEEE